MGGRRWRNRLIVRRKSSRRASCGAPAFCGCSGRRLGNPKSRNRRACARSSLFRPRRACSKCPGIRRGGGSEFFRRPRRGPSYPQACPFSWCGRLHSFDLGWASRLESTRRCTLHPRLDGDHPNFPRPNVFRRRRFLGRSAGAWSRPSPRPCIPVWRQR